MGEDKEFNDFLKFAKAAGDAAVEKGKQYTFKCPLCGNNEAVAGRSEYNGHLHASCYKCNMCFMQ